MNEDVDANLEAYKKEMELSLSILRRNRYDMVTGEWLGPDPEPTPEEWVDKLIEQNMRAHETWSGPKEG